MSPRPFSSVMSGRGEHVTRTKKHDKRMHRSLPLWFLIEGLPTAWQPGLQDTTALKRQMRGSYQRDTRSHLSFLTRWKGSGWWMARDRLFDNGDGGSFNEDIIYHNVLQVFDYTQVSGAVSSLFNGKYCTSRSRVTWWAVHFSSHQMYAWPKSQVRSSQKSLLGKLKSLGVGWLHQVLKQGAWSIDEWLRVAMHALYKEEDSFHNHKNDNYDHSVHKTDHPLCESHY